MTTRKRPTRRTGARGTTARRRRTSRGYPPARRRRPGTATTIGSALGMLAVTTLLDASWPIRIGLVALAVVLGLAYMIWRNRGEIAARAAAGADDPGPAATFDVRPSAKPYDQTTDGQQPQGNPPS